jgi:predicted NUDIX family NTP pyrophosphohydrolase
MKRSAGILAYKSVGRTMLFFLVHPGGPFWKNKDAGAWSIPKGEFDDSELPFDAAIREFGEETGFAPKGAFLPLDPVKLKSGKTVFAWAVETDIDPHKIRSNTFPLEWPPKSGKIIDVPEIDKAGWFTEEESLEKINPAQAGFIRQLSAKNTGEKH